MGVKSSIEWTESTWNPVTGCTKINEGCTHCYKDIPISFIHQVFDIMKRAHWHRFQILTKRSERLAELASLLSYPDNVWMGVTVENVSYIKRIDYLRNIPAAVRFLSLEPLLGPLFDIDLTGIDWVIVGGESGPGARPMDKKWALDIQHQCRKADVPFFLNNGAA